MYNDIDFLEIGTSNFDALIQDATETTTGISVEPIKHYLDDLPNRPKVIKVNAAIKAVNREDTCEVYYVPEHIIIENNLPSFLKGCNSINEYHLQHNLLNIHDLVVKQKVPQLSIDQLLIEYRVGKIDFLKLDTEGGDCYILQDLYVYLVDKDKQFYPNRILFESNELSDRNMVDDVVMKFRKIGYRVESRGLDTVLVLV